MHKRIFGQSIVNTVPKKDLVILLPYLGELLLQICTRINCVMKNRPLYCNLQYLFQNNCKLIIFSHLKIKFLFSNVLALFIKSSVVATLLPIMEELSAILKSGCASKHLQVSPLTGKTVKRDNNFAIK